MEVASHSAPFGFPGRDECMSGALEFLADADRVKHCSHWSGKVREDRHLGASEFRPWAWRDHLLSHQRVAE